MSATEPERYYLIETKGWFGLAGRGRATDPPNLTVTVLDRFVVHREVAHFRSEDSGGTNAMRCELARRRARALADRLNAEDSA